MSEEQRTKVLRVCQVIVGAMFQGILIFGAIVYVNRVKNANPVQLLSYVGAGAGLLLLVMSAVLPGIVSSIQKSKIRKEPKENWEGQLAALFQTQLILRCALIEGGAFINLVLTMIGSEVNGIIAATLAVMLLLQFPTKGRINWFIDTALQDFEFDSGRDS